MQERRLQAAAPWLALLLPRERGVPILRWGILVNLLADSRFFRAGWLQRETEFRALARRTFHPDTAAVALHDVLHNGQAESRAALLAGACLVHAIKSFKDAFQCFGGNARTIVLNENFEQTFGSRAAADGYRAVFAAILHRVFEQVAEDLF